MKVAVRVNTHPLVETPHGNTIVWRYMGLDKFLDLIARRRIFFSNAQTLTDQYEISIPGRVLSKKRRSLEDQGLSGRELEEEILRFQFTHSPMRDRTLLSCWSKGRDESYALWKIYLGGAKPGVAIRTTVARVRQAIKLGADDYPEDVYIGSVQYRDFIPESELTRFSLVLTKGVYYRFEEEVRLFILHFPLTEGGTQPPYTLSHGRHVAIDIGQLVDQIYVSPFAGNWFKETLQQTVAAIAPELAGRLVTSAIRDS